MLVQNKGNHSYEANGVVLAPGVNEVDSTAFSKFLEHPLMDYLDEKGEFEYSDDDKKTSAKAMIALINDTFDLEVLEKMKDGEERKTVLEAIEKRLEELQGK
ncbi:MAG: hypothetical protein RR588_00415 [Solibacillus sp.]